MSGIDFAKEKQRNHRQGRREKGVSWPGRGPLRRWLQGKADRK